MGAFADSLMQDLDCGLAGQAQCVADLGLQARGGNVFPSPVSGQTNIHIIWNTLSGNIDRCQGFAMAC
jgi:hypothetical protein